MPSALQPVLFALAVFMAALFLLLLLTRLQRDDDDDDRMAPPERVLYDHPLTFERAWRTSGDGLR